jgi:hypothetical protein
MLGNGGFERNSGGTLLVGLSRRRNGEQAKDESCENDFLHDLYISSFGFGFVKSTSCTGQDFLKRLASRSSSIKTHRYCETASAEFGFLLDAQHLAYAAQAHSIPCVFKVGERDAQLDLRPHRGTSIAPNIDPVNPQIPCNASAALLKPV